MDRAELAIEAEAVIAEIMEAFRGVTREGGVTWHEAVEIDVMGSDEQRAAARLLDNEHAWTELLDPERFHPNHLSPFTFMEPIGCRYYLAPILIHQVRVPGLHDVMLAITLEFFGDERRRQWSLAKWSLLDRAQRLAVGRFLRYQIALEALCQREVDEEYCDLYGWRQAYDSYWRAVCEGGPEDLGPSSGPPT